MRPSQIALIGTEGSGKTVLTTVLAKSLEKMQEGVWLNPQGAKTGKYIANTWNTLRNGEWVPSTPPGELFNLKWVMQIDKRECPMRMIDSAGQDLRRLFCNEEFNNPNLADQDRQFIEYIHNSTILLVLINLSDFIGESNEAKRIENGFTLKDVLDELLKDQERQIAFVFTAYDLYVETIRTKYGTVEQFLETELPYLHNAHGGKTVKCFAVAAVADTEIKTGDDGIPRRVPAHNFSSKGLKPLITWLAAAVVNDIGNQPPTPPPQPPPPPALVPYPGYPPMNPTPPEVSLWEKVIALWKTEIGKFFVGFALPVVIVVIMIFVLSPSTPKKPIPVKVSSFAKADCSHGLFSTKHQCYADALIKNNGASGNIDVTIVFFIGSKEIGRKTIPRVSINAGEEKSIVFGQVSLSECPDGQDLVYKVLPVPTAP
jgi:GTPase SAR1 family protein